MELDFDLTIRVMKALQTQPLVTAVALNALLDGRLRESEFLNFGRAWAALLGVEFVHDATVTSATSAASAEAPNPSE